MKPTLLLWIETYTEANELDPESGGEPQWTRRERPEWFEALPISGSEYSQAQQMNATVSHKLRCVYLPGCNPRMRLTAGENANNPARVWNVRSVVNENEQNRNLVWMAEEVV